MSIDEFRQPEWDSATSKVVGSPSGITVPPGNRLWRVTSVLGVIIALVIAAFQSFPLEPRQGRGVLVALVIAVAAIVVLRLLFPFAWRTLWRRPDLLVPVGIVVLVVQFLGLMAKAPLLGSLFEPEWSANVLGISFGLSLGGVLSVVVWTAFAAWQTDLLWRALHQDTVLSLAPWPVVREKFLRALGALAVGVIVLLVCLVPILAVGLVTFLLALPAMAALGILWNLVTAALLPVTLFRPGPISAALRDGLRHSWELKGRWWRQLLAQLLLLGLVTVLAVSFTATSTRTDPSGRTRQVNRQTKSNVKWNVNAFWVGGYEYQCRWYSKYAEAIEAEPVPIISQLLMLLFLVLAVAMKMTVIRELPDIAGGISPWKTDFGNGTKADPRGAPGNASWIG